jgi:sigma-E factor negative regulatory protein RseC
MQSPVATITSLSDGTATVSVSRLIACARCASGKGCGAGLLSGNQQPAEIEVRAPKSMGLRVGDTVTLELSPDSLLKASFLVYGLPLIGVVAMLLIGWAIAAPLSDGTAMVLAVVGLVVGLAIGRKQIERTHCLAEFVPKIAGHETSSIA